MEDQSKFERFEPGQEISCPDFDLLLSDAMDGALSGSQRASFEHHVNTCRTCGPIFADTQAGRHWLRSLEPMPVPVNLVHNILAATSMKDIAVTVRPEQRESWFDRLARVLGGALAPAYKSVRQPRFALNASMAFFSITLLLNVAGIRLSELHLANLNPENIKTNASLKYYETTARVVKYYENIRFVYELESTVRELKRATSSPQQEESAPEKKYDDTTQKPEKKQNQYVRERSGIVVAAMRESHRSPSAEERDFQFSPGVNHQMKSSIFDNGTHRRFA